MREINPVPVVLVISGNDPSGGAGIQADLEAIISHGCHPAPVVSALTVQNTTNIQCLIPTEPDLLLRQALCVLDDMPIAAIKIGLLGTAETAAAVAELLAQCPDIPVVLDPVLQAGGGACVSDVGTVQGLRALLPAVTLLTPNSTEARTLADNSESLDECAQQLLHAGAEFVLITGTHEDEPQVVNRLYGLSNHCETYNWDRLPHSYHGSGCTLAASIAGLLAQGIAPLEAVHQAQEYTWQSLRHAYRLGQGQHLPNRLFWVRPVD